jgi:hypothetical protein
VELAAWLVVAAWLTGLSLAVLAVARQVAVLQLHASTPSTSGYFDVHSDGPAVGSPVPDSLRAASWYPGGDFVVMILSATCGPCREVVDELCRSGGPDLPVHSFVAGRAEMAEPLLDQLAAELAGHAHGEPEASDVTQAFGVQSSPFALLVSDDIVADKRYVRAASDVLELASADDRPGKATGPTLKEASR